eukprot:scaffold8755_cov99-Isochrysis_galbana.AAC.3
MLHPEHLRCGLRLSWSSRRKYHLIQITICRPAPSHSSQNGAHNKPPAASLQSAALRSAPRHPVLSPLVAARTHAYYGQCFNQLPSALIRVYQIDHDRRTTASAAAGAVPPAVWRASRGGSTSSRPGWGRVAQAERDCHLELPRLIHLGVGAGSCARGGCG